MPLMTFYMCIHLVIPTAHIASWQNAKCVNPPESNWKHHLLMQTHRVWWTTNVGTASFCIKFHVMFITAMLCMLMMFEGAQSMQPAYSVSNPQELLHGIPFPPTPTQQSHILYDSHNGFHEYMPINNTTHSIHRDLVTAER